ncbi:glycoside hydrolase 5 family protein [Microbacterium sp.]|uniref:glycoside hydrolase 5 family protein n=1 Tax=Microbacterium sp. TaxID=51671 RepID=UPI003F6FF0F9
MKRQSAKVIIDGRARNWLGVNFWSRAGGPRMWRDYDPVLVREELRSMRDLGLNVTRSFAYWPDFMPQPNTLDETSVERFVDFLDAHLEVGLTTIPSFIVGHMSGQNWDPAWRNDRNIFTDVWFVAQQAWYIRELVARVADHPAIEAWLLTNEIPIYGDWVNRGIGTIDHASVTSWAQILIDAVRAGGSHAPVSVGDGAWGVEVTGADNGFRVREIEPLVDFHGPHVYRMETDPVRQNLGAAFICEILDIGGKPVVMEEFGVTSDYVSEEHAANYYRQILHNTLLAGATGWLAWNNTDYDSLADVEPYSHHPFEMHFGITDKNGAIKPQGHELRLFADLLERIDASGLTRPDSDVVLIVPSYLEAQYPFTQPQDKAVVFDVSRQAYVSAREADIPVGVAREFDGLPADARLYLLPSAKQFTAPGWAFLRSRAHAGATVYASSFLGEHRTQRGTWWPDLDETFGVRRLSRYGLVDPVTADEVYFHFQQDFGNIRAGETLRFPVAGNEDSRAYLAVESAGADVIAVDGQGRPALLRHRTGAGQFVLSTYPVEYFAARIPNVNPSDAWRVYSALAHEAGAAPDVWVETPDVVVGTLVHDNGTEYIWVVSQSDTHATVTVSSSRGRLTDLDGHRREQVELDPYGVKVLRREDEPQ